MKLKLSEIPQEGREYIINRQTAELNQDLKDLIGENAYDLKIFIRPLTNSDYEVKGSIRAETKEMCSLCGDAFNFKVTTKINEILIPAAGREKSLEKQSRSNHLSELDDAAPAVTEVKNEVFELGEFAHQAIALQVPYNPMPEQNEDGSCQVCLMHNLKEPLKYDEDMGVFEKAKAETNPFLALKDLKTN